MEEKTKKKRGYLSNFANYRDWYMSHDLKWQKDHRFKCEHCGKKFIPSSPNQKFCGPENESCYKARKDMGLADGQWVKKMTAEMLTSYHDKTYF